MCLAVPGRITEIHNAASDMFAAGGDAASSMGRTATVDMHGSRIEASLAMTPEAGVGDWILVHAGFALAVLDEEEAQETWQSLQLALSDEAERDDVDHPTATESG